MIWTALAWALASLATLAVVVQVLRRVRQADLADEFDADVDGTQMLHDLGLISEGRYWAHPMHHRRCDCRRYGVPPVEGGAIRDEWGYHTAALCQPEAEALYGPDEKEDEPWHNE